MHFKPQKSLENSRILITNDDGINAFGIQLLEKILLKITPHVYVVAPVAEKSGASHSITTNKLRSMMGHTSVTDFPHDVTVYDDKHFAVDGTPSDCIRVALNMILSDNYPDIIISGINNGRNIADDITYSGTVGAAVEGILYGIPAIAVSQLTEGRKEINWQMAERYLPMLLNKICQGVFSADTLININFPNVPFAEMKGIEICRQGTRRFTKGTTEYDRLSKTSFTTEASPEKQLYPADNEEIKDKITLSALKINLTDEKGLAELRKLFA